MEPGFRHYMAISSYVMNPEPCSWCVYPPALTLWQSVLSRKWDNNVELRLHIYWIIIEMGF